MFTLYQLSGQYKKAIDSLFDEENPSRSPIEEIKESFETKVINCVKYLKNLEAEGDAIKKEIDAMCARHKSINKKMEKMADYISMNINETGLAETIKCPEFSVKLQENPPSVDIYDELAIPNAYKIKKEVISINKDLLKRDIKDDFDVPGARLIRKKRLVIK